LKDNSILTTKELSKYLKLNEKTIIKMAQSRDLPGFKIGSKWRFYLSVVDEYLQDKIIRFPKKYVSKLPELGSGSFPLSRLIDESCIDLNLKSKTVDGILYELSEIAQKSNITVSIERLVIQLKKREQMLSTAIGEGVAIPHPRNPSDDLFKRAGFMIGRSVKGVNFGAPDNKKTHIFFMLCATDVILHLNLLSSIARLIDKKEVVKKILNAKTKKNILKLLLESERPSISNLSE